MEEKREAKNHNCHIVSLRCVVIIRLNKNVMIFSVLV